ncbi:hypothetical protein RUND412_000891 [Rhizina undulata]
MAKTKSQNPKKSKRTKDPLSTTGGLNYNPLSTTPSSSSSSNTPKTPSQTELLSAASTLLHTHTSPTEALAVLSPLLEASPVPLPALELFAEIQIELGDEERAYEAYKQAAELDPSGLPEESGGSGPEKFLWLAQLGGGGWEAVAWYEKGVEIIRSWIGRGGSAERGLEKKLVSALCGLVEIFMSDLCMEADAEARCEKYITEALLVVPNSPEGLQTLASIRVSQQRVDDAIAALGRSFELWKDLDPSSNDIPSYANRIILSKLLIETSQYETALEVLERLQLEDDQLPDLWYLGGWSLYLLGEQDREAGGEGWKELWDAAREWLANCEKLYKALEWEDEGIKDHACELLENINKELPESLEGEEDGDGDEEEEWGDDSDEEMGDS